MMVAVFSESAADEAAIRVFVEGLLGGVTRPPSMPPIRSRGWPAVLHLLPVVLKHLHYQNDAEALVVVADSDRSPVHRDPPDGESPCDQRCRLCALRSVVTRATQQLRPKGDSGVIKTGLGLAVPQIEAWYLAGVDPHVSEAAWISGQKTGTFPYARESLKRKVYATDRPAWDLEIRRAREEAERILHDAKLPLLESLFPSGFGALAKDVRSWRATRG
jgi:hypothetical protein